MTGSRTFSPAGGVVAVLCLACSGAGCKAERPAPRVPEASPADDGGRAVGGGGPALLRDEQRAVFLASRGLYLGSRLSDNWVTPGSEVQLELLLQNLGDRSVGLRMERLQGFWPFRTEERACARVVLRQVSLSPRYGLYHHRTVADRDDLETLSLAPGETRRISLPFVAPSLGNGDYVFVQLRPTLMPLAILVEDEPERFVALPFPAQDLHVVPLRARERRGDATLLALQEEIHADGDLVVPLAMMNAARDLVQTVDLLISSLPGPSARTRACSLVALEWLTGQGNAGMVDLWRSWWDSPAGQAWLARQRGGFSGAPPPPDDKKASWE